MLTCATDHGKWMAGTLAERSKWFLSDEISHYKMQNLYFTARTAIRSECNFYKIIYILLIFQNFAQDDIYSHINTMPHYTTCYIQLKKKKQKNIYTYFLIALWISSPFYNN